MEEGGDGMGMSAPKAIDVLFYIMGGKAVSNFNVLFNF